MCVNWPAANDAVSPDPIVLLVVNAAQNNRFPVVAASNTPKCVTVPHDPVAVTNVIAFALLIDPADDVFQSEPAVLLRAYDPPLTSVPPPLSDGAAVYSAT